MSKKRQVFHIYVDESSKNDTYFAVGAILCENKSAAAIASEINQLVASHQQRPDKEIHWKEFKNSSLLVPLYCTVGTTLISFTQNKPRRMRFRSIIVERQHIIRDRDNGETMEDVIAKFIFTLVFNMAEQVGGSVDYFVYIDSPDGDERSDIRTRSSLNNRYKTKFNAPDGPFKSVKFVRSEASRLIQATDLMTGVIAYEMNGRHLAPGAALHKRKVFADMLAQSKLTTFTVPTKHYPPQFQIQHFDFTKSQFTRFQPVMNPQLDLLD